MASLLDSELSTKILNVEPQIPEALKLQSNLSNINVNQGGKLSEQL
jgi:hypothetical protein